jgi:putative serine protease PepD
MCGIRFVTKGERFDTFMVFSIFEGSPAAGAGIREGDIVTAVDGRAAETFTRETLGAHLRREGAEVRITIMRGGKSRQVPLTLRRMV